MSLAATARRSDALRVTRGPGGSNKLDFNAVGVHIDDGTKITGAQTMCRRVAVQNDGIEKCEGHCYSGRTVTSLTSSRPGACIHTVTTRVALRGPLKSARNSVLPSEVKVLHLRHLALGGYPANTGVKLRSSGFCHASSASTPCWAASSGEGPRAPSDRPARHDSR
jgi:hypothetical protein